MSSFSMTLIEFKQNVIYCDTLLINNLNSISMLYVFIIKHTKRV